MNKHILKYVAVCLAALSFTACNDSESDLLEPKVYFDSKESKLVVEDQESMDYDLSARLSNRSDADVDVSSILFILHFQLCFYEIYFKILKIL